MHMQWCGGVPLESFPGGRGWARGYAFAPDGGLLRDGAIARHLLDDPRPAGENAPRLNGCFAAVIEGPDGAVAVTDRYGSIPLYATTDGEAVLLADEPWPVIAAAPSPPQLDRVGVADMLRLGYVAGERTLLDGLRVVPSATVRRIDAGGVRDTRYWRYSYPRVDPDLRYDDAARDLLVRYERVGQRIDEFAGGRGVRLLATGGLDTRVLVGLLATRTTRPVHLASYGLPEDPDVLAGSRLAEALGWPFTYVPIDGRSIDDDSLLRAVREIGVTSRFTTGAGARAVGDAPDSVTMLGHTGFLSSAAAIVNWPADTLAQVRRLVYLRHYSWAGSEAVVHRVTRDSLHDVWETSITETLAEHDPADSGMTSMHRWNADNRQRKLVLRELQVYGDQGPWMLPLNDHEVVDCFLSLPWSLRLDQQLYARTALDALLVGPAAAAAAVPRVGASQFVRPTRERWFRAARALQPVSGVVGTALMGAAHRVHWWRRSDTVLRKGANPLRYWFHTDPVARQFFLDRIDGITCSYIDAAALRQAVTAPDAPEDVFQRLLTGALTVQVCEEEAARVWRAGAAARAARREPPAQ